MDLVEDTHQHISTVVSDVSRSSEDIAKIVVVHDTVHLSVGAPLCNEVPRYFVGVKALISLSQLPNS